MAEVTDLKYVLENKLISKLDLMIERCIQNKPKKDAWFINEGGEGEGKTNASVAEAYYVKFKTKRDIHMFFRTQDAIEFAQKYKDKIIILDEPALDSLSADALTQLNKDLLRLAMTIRSHRHFFIMNCTKFHKFSEYLIVERSLGMVHMYSRKEVQSGRFFYIRKKKLELLWNDYRSKHQRNYKKHKSFGGKFPEVMEQHFDKMGIYVNGIPNATLEIYNTEKTKGIGSIGQKKLTKDKIDLHNLKCKLGQLRPPIKSRDELAARLGINSKRLREWALLQPIGDVSLGNEAKIDTAAAYYSLIGTSGVDDSEGPTEKEEENNESLITY